MLTHWRQIWTQDVLVLNLGRSVQVCVDIGAHLLGSLDQPVPATMGETFSRLADAAVLDAALEDFEDFARAIVGYTAARG